MSEKKTLLLGLLFVTTLIISAQEKYIDAKTRVILDSLDNRIVEIDNKIRSFGANRDAKYFHAKRELDMTVFLREYEELIYDEDITKAQRLIESRLRTSTKRADKYAMEYYSSYKKRLTKLRGEKRAHYQKLFEKEKVFMKEYEKYVKPANEYAYIRTLHMLDLAIKFASEMGRGETLRYLYYYRSYTEALMFDLKNEYDLKKLTSAEGQFLKSFGPLVESDSLEIIQESQKLVNYCFQYTALARSELDTNYFETQKVVVANALADWNERQGTATELTSLTGQATIARRDSVNKEGIYQWNDYILVIGSLNFKSKSENVRKGEAIIDADNTIYNYVRINKIAKVNRSMEMGKTIILPVEEEGKVSYYRWDYTRQAFQYMVAYSSVVNSKVTREMAKFLPPLQFQDDIEALIE